MALNFVRKINSAIIQNFEQAIYGRASLATLRNIPEAAIKSTTNNESNKGASSERNEDGNSEAHRNKTLQTQQLQPALLPEYYKPHVDLHVGTYPNPPPLEQPHQDRSYRLFETSNTYKNVMLPLKKPKLASPFPDPVKEMPSDTVSDEEKAAQMQAEMKKMSLEKKRMNVDMKQTRYYSTVGADPKKCKKVKKKGKKKCVKRVLPGCKPPKSIDCDHYDFKDCKKKKAPYPAYSEACHTIPDEKPSECKLCPWKPAEHPHFRKGGKKKGGRRRKKFHTSAITFCPKKADREKKLTKRAAASGWVDITPWQRVEESTDLTGGFDNEVLMKCMKKKPCKRPKSFLCKKSKKKKKKRKRKSRSKRKKGKRKSRKGRKRKSRRKSKKRKGRSRKRKGKKRGKKRKSKKRKRRSKRRKGKKRRSKSRKGRKRRSRSRKGRKRRKGRKGKGKGKRKCQSAIPITPEVDTTTSWMTIEESELVAPSVFSLEFQDSPLSKYGPVAIEAQCKKGKKKRKSRKKSKRSNKRRGKKRKRSKRKRRRKGRKGRKSRKRRKSKKKRKRKKSMRVRRPKCKKSKKKKKKKCKKLKFPGCKPKKRRSKKRGKAPPCPKRKSKKPIKDCPSKDKADKCKKSAPLIQSSIDYNQPLESMVNYMEKIAPSSLPPITYQCKKKKKKCPKIKSNKCDKKLKDDPCGLRRKGKSRVCPGDLLKKKRRKPKKPRRKPFRKSIGIITPNITPPPVIPSTNTTQEP